MATNVKKEINVDSSEVYFSRPTETLLIEANPADCLPNGFSKLWQSKKRCDLTLFCQGEEFTVHSLILYGFSPYFSELIDKFKDPPAPSRLTVNCDGGLMKYCLEFLYTGKVEMSRDQLENVAHLAKEIGMMHLYKKCKEFQFKVITKENCLRALCYAESVGKKKAMKASLQLAIEAFEELSETDGFMSLCTECALSLLTHDGLAVSSPGDRLSAAIAWIEYESEKRAEHIISFLEKMSLCDMSKAVLRLALRSTCVQRSERATGMINKALSEPKTGESEISVAKVPEEPSKSSSFGEPDLRFTRHTSSSAQPPSVPATRKQQLVGPPAQVSARTRTAYPYEHQPMSQQAPGHREPHYVRQQEPSHQEPLYARPQESDKRSKTQHIRQKAAVQRQPQYQRQKAPDKTAKTQYMRT